MRTVSAWIAFGFLDAGADGPKKTQARPPSTTALPSTPGLTASPRALAASAVVTTEQESKFPAAAEFDGEGEGAAALVAGVLVVASALVVAGALVVASALVVAGALVAGAVDAGAGAGEDDDVQAASERAAKLAMTEIATDCRRI
jgi:hypothetical protein